MRSASSTLRPTQRSIRCWNCCEGVARKLVAERNFVQQLCVGRSCRLRVQPALEEAEQALRDEDDHQGEDDANRDQVVLSEEAREALAQQEEERRAGHWPYQRPHPAHN